MFHEAFVTTTRGLQRDIPPDEALRKSQKAGHLES